MSRVLVGLSLILVGSLLSCGEKAGPNIAVQFSPETALSDPAAFDLVFTVTNIPADGQMLDQDGNGTPDTFAYPGSCDASFPPQCGVPVATGGTVDIGKLPLNFQYSIEARFRNSTGQILYSGSNQFTNSTNIGAVTIGISSTAP